jgi:hypothetical protein
MVSAVENVKLQQQSARDKQFTEYWWKQFL